MFEGNKRTAYFMHTEQFRGSPPSDNGIYKAQQTLLHTIRGVIFFRIYGLTKIRSIWQHEVPYPGWINDLKMLVLLKAPGSTKKL